MGRIQGDLVGRTLAFGIATLKFAQMLPSDARGWTVGKQLLRCGTAIGANVREVDNALTEREFTHRMSVARKEAAETVYWLELIQGAELASGDPLAALRDEAQQLLRILGTIVARMHGAAEEPG